MAEIRTHSKPEAIWLFDYNSLLAMDDCPKYVVLLSERDINIIWQSVINIDKFRSRVFTEKNGNKYTIADLDQWGLFREWVSDMNVNMGDFMTCNGVLEDILEQLTIMANRECCPSGGVGGGSAGAGTSPAAPSPQETTTEAREGDPPAGSASWSEYDSEACKMAAKIIDDMIVDLAQGGIKAAGVLTVTTLAPILVAAFLTPVPFDDIIVVAWLFIQILFIAISISELTSLLEDNKDALVCEILSGTDVASSISAFSAKIVALCEADGEISGFGDLGVKASSDLINSFATVNSFNRIYELPAYPLPDYECDCDEGYFFIDGVGGIFGTKISGSMLGTAVIESGYGSLFGANRNFLILTATGSPQESEFTINSIVDAGEGSASMQVYDVTLTLDYDTGTTTWGALVSENHTGARQVHIYSLTPDVDNPFRIEFTFAD